jgi:hypothetical protein
VEEPYTFYPPRRPGLIFLGVIAALFLLVNIWNLYWLGQATIGPGFLRGLIIALLAPIPLLWLGYRIWALQRASYSLRRDGISLRWGMRVVDIPMTEVEWVQPDDEIQGGLSLPWLRLHGAVLGTGRHQQAGSPVEFMAAGVKALIFIATPERIFAISPQEPELFMQVFHELGQFGSLDPITGRSVFPSFWFGNVWQVRPIRYILLAALVLNLALMTWVSLVGNAHPMISLGFTPEGMPLEPLPAAALWILPLLNFIVFLADWFLGLFLYRNPEHHRLSYLLWGSSAFVGILFLGALYYILQTG